MIYGTTQMLWQCQSGLKSRGKSLAGFDPYGFSRLDHILFSPDFVAMPGNDQQFPTLESLHYFVENYRRRLHFAQTY